MRKAEGANPVAYRGADIAHQQALAYPDISPLVLPMGLSDAFRLASAVVRTMPNWSLVSESAAADRVEASETSHWFRFTHVIVIRVRGDQTESRIDVRSTSQQGRRFLTKLGNEAQRQSAQDHNDPKMMLKKD